MPRFINCNLNYMTKSCVINDEGVSIYPISSQNDSLFRFMVQNFKYFELELSLILDSCSAELRPAWQCLTNFLSNMYQLGRTWESRGFFFSPCAPTQSHYPSPTLMELQGINMCHFYDEKDASPLSYRVDWDLESMWWVGLDINQFPIDLSWSLVFKKVLTTVNHTLIMDGVHILNTHHAISIFRSNKLLGVFVGLDWIESNSFDLSFTWLIGHVSVT